MKEGNIMTLRTELIEMFDRFRYDYRAYSSPSMGEPVYVDEALKIVRKYIDNGLDIKGYIDNLFKEDDINDAKSHS